ncbi:serine/threonine protein kinase [Sorangium sp. So ce131]|uniref:serine/threonine protein kinase n=1 Tax=Sorangium sp. So ce131 TaxID=3133282 RepID=UPI003F63E8C3
MTAPNVAPGSVVAGRFSVRSLLGYGGATATFRAVTAQARDVALKLYSPVIGQRPDVMQHLQRYVAETNRLPNELAAHILEAGYDPATAAPFTVTDMLLIPSLADVAVRRPMTFEEVGAMLRSLAAVLDAAHAREVPHNGLRPTNLFIDPSSPGHVKVTDFGPSLARTLLPTPEGYVLSAPWLAPEQLQPGAHTGAAADIFSAALIAFFALTGRSYWRSCQGQVDVAAWQREIMAPRLAASARAAELGIPLSPALDASFARALAHDPRERFRSASELAAALSGFSAHAIEVGSTLALSPAAEAVAPSPPGHAAAVATLQPPVDVTQLAPSPLASPPQLAPPPHVPPPVQAPPHVPPPVQAPPHVPPSPVASPQQPAPSRPLQPTLADENSAPEPSFQAKDAVASSAVVPAPALTAVINGQRSPRGKAASLAVGVAAVLLVGGAAAAWFAMDHGDKPAPGPSASASSEVAPSAPPVEPPPSQVASAPAVDAGSPVAAPDAGAANAGATAAASTDVPARITCKPVACEEITVDGKAVADPADIRLTPGVHKLGVRRAGYFPRTQSVVVKAGTPVEQEFELTAIPPGPAQPAAPSKPCGKFLKRCK